MKSLSWFCGCALLLGVMGCEAPEQQCIVGRARNVQSTTGSHASRFTLKSGQDPLALTECGTLVPDRVGLQKFFPNGPNKMGSLGIQTTSAGALALTSGTTGTPYSLGNFTANNPDADNSCVVESFVAATLVVPASGANPERTYKWDWSNVKVYSTAKFPGTLFTADLSYTLNTCTAQYSVVGIWPALTCSTDAACYPYPDPANGRPNGSGLNPSFCGTTEAEARKQNCPNLKCQGGYCVLAGALPTID